MFSAIRTRIPSILPIFSFVLALSLVASSAVAAEDGPLQTSLADAAPGYPQPHGAPASDFKGAIDRWNDANPWRYDSGRIFQLTRGLEEAGVSRVGRPFVMILSIPFDLATLPVAALAGLFGD